ncbi:hypothetical protein DFH01_27445 [Falsiroseomonas bella]|uniref:Uncharacterized protein n=1 Tax=Falsiroseomonas bella TaxID=2184016 RepID=A0A317F5D0_9PROT|nr:hypothetical protein [Falsiroseomonas bella]PWS34065.1 hypothetical protein DFH01_27445 [Falsiroseomonas bella]
MDGRDMERCVGKASRRRAPRAGIEALRRNQQPIRGATAEDCLRAGRDPDRKLEKLRRDAGGAEALRA